MLLHRRSSLALGSLLCALSVPACSTPAARVCDPGSTQRCVCASGEGAQSCNADGTGWLTCSCGGEVDADVRDGGVSVDAFSTLDTGAIDASTPSDAGSDANLPACAAGATIAPIQDLTNGTVGEATQVAVLGAVAMSPPFLLQRSVTTGTCLWAVFVSAPALSETAPGTGILVTSYGDNATIPPGGSTAFCPVRGMTPTGSLIPDDLVPGDVLDIVGEVRTFLPTTCGSTPGAATTGTRLLGNTCSIERRGTATPPAPHVLSAAEAAQLAQQSDDAFHRLWDGVLVRVENVTASPPASPAACGRGESVVDALGAIVLDGSGARIGDRVFYDGFLSASGDTCHAVPRYCGNGPQSFTAIEGFVALDFCTWSIWPADRCADYAPGSDDCSVAACLP